MKICLIGPTYPFRGGISHYTTLLFQHLRDRHQVKLYSYIRQYPRLLFPGQTDRDPSRAAFRAECEYLVDPLNPLTWLRVFWKLKEDAPDLLILQWTVPYWAITLASIAALVRTFTATRVLFICHNVMPHAGERVGLLDKGLVKLALGQGDHFIVHSEKDLQKLQGLLPEADIHKAFLPTYTVFNVGSLPGKEAKHCLGLRGNTLLFFGFVRPYKGVEYLLRAMPEVQKHVDVHLLIAGEFWIDENYYRHLIRELNLEQRVTIVNRYIPNEEVGSYFSAADVVVLPYVEATQSAVVQVAYGFAKPVITTNVGGLAEVVKDGETGLVVSPQDSGALAEAIVRYFTQNLGPLFADNIRALSEGFAWHTVVDLIEEIGVPRSQEHQPDWSPEPPRFPTQDSTGT